MRAEPSLSSLGRLRWSWPQLKRSVLECRVLPRACGSSWDRHNTLRVKEPKIFVPSKPVRSKFSSKLSFPIMQLNQWDDMMSWPVQKIESVPRSPAVFVVGGYQASLPVADGRPTLTWCIKAGSSRVSRGGQGNPVQLLTTFCTTCNCSNAFRRPMQLMSAQQSHLLGCGTTRCVSRSWFFPT